MKKETVIITGGSSGMGLAMATHFLGNGANVVVTGRNEDKLNEALSNAEGQERILRVVMDVREPEDVKKMVEKTHDTFGRIDHLVNNAAGNFIQKAEEMSPNGWKSVIDIVLNGTFYCSREVMNYWIANKTKGSILNMVATYAWNAGAGVVHSASAKAGVLTMTRTLAVEWGRRYGVRVNAIAPGPIERTGGAEKLFQSEDAYKRTLGSVPLGRVGTPEEIAKLAGFILSEDASYMNGEVVTLDGGQWLNQFPF
ncbi:2,4-dienoyl-CoA reductase [Salimicrobium salexigens]|uniref:NAD(P)-dependent dehydrogenase, short-chain alcohol dehydrogenase family n=1 Tax=Salimicrobium salexigens TaxID=908941 RepID=A0ABY1KLK3_9BACI|nr:2,4-dienoyl-CoA reductase [Salimicrobium salexigens]SIS47689.1 NAD(P)-dependent dehydrogenase, short-chain alcohol dehydrogenase family [Salimicrobium salexigens]